MAADEIILTRNNSQMYLIHKLTNTFLIFTAFKNLESVLFKLVPEIQHTSLKMKKVVLFGTGSGLKDIISILPADIKVVSLSDNNVKMHNTDHLNYVVNPPSKLKDIDFDYLIITSRAGEEVKSGLITLGIEKSKIIIFNNSFNNRLASEANQDINRLNQELGFSIPAISLCSMYLAQMQIRTRLFLMMTLCATCLLTS